MLRQMHIKLKGYLLIVTAAVLWGGIGPVSKLAFAQRATPMEVAFWRAVLAWFFFGIHAVVKKETGIVKTDIPFIILFALTGVTLFYSSYQMAVKNGSAALAAVLLYTAPAWVAVMSRFFFKESLTLVKLLALLLTLAGVFLVSYVPAGTGNTGMIVSVNVILFGLLAGFFYSLYYIFGKYFSNRYSAPNLFLYILPIGALGLMPWVRFSGLSPVSWGALIFIAFFSTYGAYYCYYSGLKFLEPTRAAITATIEPVVAAFISFLWWGEYFTGFGYAGSLLILAAVVLMVLTGSRSG